VIIECYSGYFEVSPNSLTINISNDFRPLNILPTQRDCDHVMKPCDHSHWLGLYKRDSETTFTHTERAQNLLHDLPYSESQKPSLFVLIGNRRKNIALHDLASGSIRKKSIGPRGHGEIHLYNDPSSIFSDRPVLFADGDFPTHQKLEKIPPTWKCHRASSNILPRLRDGILRDSNLLNATDTLYFRLLSPFTDVFCFFAADLGGLPPIVDRVASWLNMGRASTLPATTHPRIVIVTESTVSEPQENYFLKRFLRLLRTKTRLDISTQFAGVRVLSLLLEGDISSQSRHRRLRECLMNMSDQTRLARIESRTLFSAQHLASFLKHACLQLDESRQPFNFIETARLDHPPASDLTEHLTNFLSKITTPQKLKDFAIPLIASSLLLDSYPPDMHRE